MNEESSQKEVQAKAPEGAQSTVPEVSGWRTGLSEELQESKSLQSFGDVNALAKAFIDTKRMQGNSIHLLGDDATPEQRATQMREILGKVAQALPGDEAYNVIKDKMPDAFDDGMAQAILNANRPEDINGYGAPEGIDTPDEAWRQIAFDNSLSDKQSMGMLSALNEHNKSQYEQAVSAYDSSVQALRGEYGAAYEDKYRQAEHAAKAISKKTGVSEHADAFADGVAPPDLIRLYSGIFDSIGSESSDVAKDNTVDNRHNTPDEARKQIAEINNNKEHEYWTALGGTDRRKQLDDMMLSLMGEANRKVA